MKTDLVPIKVKIKHGLVNGRAQHIYPDFNQIPLDSRGSMDWSYFIDTQGTGWLYDELSGIGEVDVVNPDPDVWYGCMCVPQAFAAEAVLKFPDDVEIINEVAFEDFFNNRSKVNVPENKTDVEVLQALAARESLGENVDIEKAKAINPSDSALGVRKDMDKKWEDYKSKRGMTIHFNQKKVIK